MWPIRIFIIYYDTEVTQLVYTCTKFEKLYERVQSLLDEEIGNILVHIGFSIPDAETKAVLNLDTKRIFFTPSAKHALFEYVACEKYGMTSGDRAIYTAIDGFGKTWPSLGHKNVESGTQSSEFNFPEGTWVKDCATKFPEKSKLFVQYDIYDDHSYLANEKAIDETNRYLLGLYRYKHLCIQNPPDTYLSVLENAPPIFLEREIESIEFPVRIRNGLMNLGIEKVSELAQIGESTLMQTRNMGKKSIQQLAEALKRGVEDIPSQYATDLGSTEGRSTFYEQLLFDLVDYKQNARETIKMRLGVSEAPMSLNTIANIVGLTRERIRQLEKQAVEKLTLYSEAIKSAITRLDTVRSKHEYPISLDILEEKDGWFKGVKDNKSPINHLCKKGCLGTYSIIEIDSNQIVTRISEDEWAEILDLTEAIVDEGIRESTPVGQIEISVKALVPEDCRELRSELWNTVLATSVIKENLIVSANGNDEKIVSNLLHGSDIPLHYSTVAEQFAKLTGKGCTPPRANSILQKAKGSLLFDRGIYGVRKHFGLSDDQIQSIRIELEKIITSGIKGRQWHSNELLELIKSNTNLLAQTESQKVELTRYHLDIILKTSELLIPLGRHSWQMIDKTGSDVYGRIELQDLIAAILEDNGRPLTTSELREEVKKRRGINSHFQIQEKPPIIRVKKGLFGLDGRDNAMSEADEQKVTEVLQKILGETQKGIFEDEIKPHFKNNTLIDISNFDTGNIIECARRSEYLKIAPGGKYIYLAEWGDKRRISRKEVIRELEESSTMEIDIETFHSEMETLTELEIDRATLINELAWAKFSRVPGTNIMRKT